MDKITKPMLSGKAQDIEKLSYPLYATPKLDGIRCLKVDGKVVSRTFKPIKNDHIRETLEANLPDNIDGEILSGNTFQECTSAVMTIKGEPDFIFYAFDYVPENLDDPYLERILQLENWLYENDVSNVEVLLPVEIKTPEELESYEKEMLAKGYEGVMVRSGMGPYKCGRATAREGYLLKIKRFDDSEAEVIGFEERLHNMNEAKKDNFGRIERSSHKKNKVPAGDLGKLICRDLETGIEFGVGTGFTQQQREEYWKERDNLIGKFIKYKSFNIGVKEAPRHPVFLGWRDPDDM